MHSTYLCQVVFAFAATGVFTQSDHAGPDAKTIMKRCEANLSFYRTYQAVWEASMSMGQMGVVALNLDMKISPSDRKSSLKIAPLGQPTGSFMMAAPNLNAWHVGDCKNSYLYL